MKRCIKLILNALYGREYYAVIVGERGSDRYDLTSRIHHTAEEAEAAVAPAAAASAAAFAALAAALAAEPIAQPSCATMIEMLMMSEAASCA